MSKLDLKPIRARVSMATSGPWEAFLDPEVERYDPAVCANGHVVCRLNDETEWDDVQFIAHAREDVPALCDEVERLQAALKIIAALLKPYAGEQTTYRNVPMAHEEALRALNGTAT